MQTMTFSTGLVIVTILSAACSLDLTPSQTTSNSHTRPAIEFYNVYSRPNDDTFQNAAGNAGEPYEVARIHNALEFHDLGAQRFEVRYHWGAVMVTGRHVEAGHNFMLQQTHNSLNPGQVGATVQLGVHYPDGVGPESRVEEKRSCQLHGEAILGAIDFNTNGSYQGRVLLRRLGSDGEPDATHQGGPSKGVFMFLHWGFEVFDGSIVNVSIESRRFKDPPIKLIASNFQEIDTSRPEHRPYPVQPPAAICAPELVGEDGDEVAIEETVDLIESKFRQAIVTAQCTLCHGEGNRDNQLFCDDGRSIRPETDAHSIFTMMYHKHLVSRWDSYPGFMRRGIGKLEELDADQSITNWVRRYGVRPETF